MDNQTHTPITRGNVGPYSIRGFRYANSGEDQDVWSGTLMRDGQRVARLNSQRREGPVAAMFVSPERRRMALGFARAWAEADGSDAADEESALQELLLNLVEGAYHLRLLQIQARLHTLFRLEGDPEDQFRTVRNVPYTTAQEGALRLAYGQRLVEIIRREAAAESADGPTRLLASA